MAERESRRTTVGACVRGSITGTLITGTVWGTIYATGFLFNPVLRDIAGGVRVPDGWIAWVFSAAVGVVCGWAVVRNGRIYVAADGSTGNALTIARANARVGGSGRGAAVDAPVQRWSDDLLASGDVLEDQGLTS